MNKGLVLRDAALKLEGSDVQLALSLMTMALEYRPGGPLIISKIKSYKEQIAQEKASYNILRERVSCGKLALIPIGFRCYTKQILKNEFGIKQASLPFDSGFFTPHSVANILRNGKVNLVYGQSEQNHTICMKYEKARDATGNSCIKFERSSYDFVNNSIDTLVPGDTLNQFLDSTYGYYTLDEDNKFILAHYNWHALASDGKSLGVKCPSENIPIINEIMNKRIKRMFSLCSAADKILFIFYNSQNFSSMLIDDEKYDLTCFDELTMVMREKFGDKFIIECANDHDSLNDILVKYTRSIKESS